MGTRLYNLWEKLRTTFWVVPALMVTAVLIALVVFLNLDKHYDVDAAQYLSFLQPLSPSGARTILSTIAGSMITVAGTVFSITIVTLTLASNQFGPSLLRNFMQSTVNQVVLGSFIATFVYCLCALGAVEPAGTEGYVPSLSVNFAVFLAMFNVSILIYFIHHVSTSIQVETVLNNINTELVAAIEAYFPQGPALEKSRPDAELRVPPTPANTQTVESDAFGYLQAVDKSAIDDFAKKHRVTLKVMQNSGTFIARGLPLLQIYGQDSMSDQDCNQLRDAFLLGPQRTSEQDIEYSITQLVAIAVRALSPGINDPFTALACIDYIGAVLCRIASRQFPEEKTFNDENQIVVIYKAVTFTEIVAASFNEIRRHSIAKAPVLIRLLDVLNHSISLCADPKQREVLLQHAQLVRSAGLENLVEPSDRQALDDRYQAILE